MEWSTDMANATTLLPEIEPPPGDAAKLYEVVDGRVVEPPPMSAFEYWISTSLAGILIPFLKEHRIGRVAVETLFWIDRAAKLQRRPDLAFVSYDRWPRDRPVPRTEAWDVVPDLAVEIVSPSNGAVELQSKIEEYIKGGVRTIWAAYPTLGLVLVYESATSVRVLRRGDDIDGGAVLPGFRLPLASWFDEEV
jgi:Uma2 family endonuclease